jgi:hypothetical protein
MKAASSASQKPLARTQAWGRGSRDLSVRAAAGPAKIKELPQVCDIGELFALSKLGVGREEASMPVGTFVVGDLKWPVSDHQSSAQQQWSLLT